MSLSNRLNKHFVACAAGVAAIAAVSAADASIVWSGAVSINVPTTTAGVYLNVVANTTGATNALAGWDINAWGTGTALNFFSSTSSGQTVATGMVGTGTIAANLASGTLISAASVFTTNVGTQTTSGTINNSNNNIFGFKFWNEGAAAFRYGWIRLQLGASAGAQPRNILEYAWENTGAGINAGDNGVPGPAGLAVLALGALGSRNRRRA